jgi:glycerophosphoryl diester phosphodiesterase
MIIYEICFRVIATTLAAPLLAWLVATLVASSGTAAVSNTAIARFLLTPAGMASALTLALGYLLGQLLLSAGLTAIAAMALSGRPVSVGQAVGVAARSSLLLLRVGIVQLAALAWLIAPFLGLAALTYGLLLSAHDINYYLAEKPPAFLAAVAIGAVLGAILLANAAAAYIRFLFVLPVVLFEGGPIRSALRTSSERCAGAWLPIGGCVLTWHALVAVAAPFLGLFYALCARRLLALAGVRVWALLPIGVLVLVIQGWLLAAIAFLQVAGSSLLTVRLYDERSRGRARAWADGVATNPAVRVRVPRWAWGLALAGLALALLSAGLQVLATTRSVRPVSITAHRGASREAPENTLAALQKAIDHGVDYAEIDVHLTADAVPVLVHDEDFQRLAGDPRRPADLTLEQIRQLDVGSPFGPAFAGERVPTLAQAIELVRGKIRLNIELKPTNADRVELARAVAGLIRAHDFEGGCFVTSLDRRAVEEAKRQNPGLRTGAIVSAAVGDVTRLEVDVLSIRAGLISDALLDRAHGAGREVHAWTIDDPAAMARLIDQGVDGIITNEPAAALAVRVERQSLPDWQRLVLSLQSRLAGR